MKKDNGTRIYNAVLYRGRFLAWIGNALLRVMELVITYLTPCVLFMVGVPAAVFGVWGIALPFLVIGMVLRVMGTNDMEIDQRWILWAGMLGEGIIGALVPTLWPLLHWSVLLGILGTLVVLLTISWWKEQAPYHVW